MPLNYGRTTPREAAYLQYVQGVMDKIGSEIEQLNTNRTVLEAFAIDCVSQGDEPADYIGKIVVLASEKGE